MRRLLPLKKLPISLLIIHTIFFLNLDELHAARVCANTFSSSESSSSDLTETFISYLSQLYEIEVLTTQDLYTFRTYLQKHIWSNPISPLDAISNSIASVHYDEFEKYLKSTNLNRKKILFWLAKIISREKREDSRYTHAIVKTKDAFFPITFNPLQMNENTYIEVMNAPVTEYQWAKVIREFYVEHDAQKNPELILMNGKSFLIRPNHPMIDLTVRDGLRFANQLSLLHRYYPFYKFGNVSWDLSNGKLCCLGGTVWTTEDEPLENKTQGYRIPTPKEFDFLYQTEMEYFFVQNHRKQLTKYFWNMNNSRFKLHEIATLRPRYIQGKKFYDLFGNNHEWSIEQKSSYSGGEHCLYSSSYREYLVEFGSWLFGTRVNGNNPSNLPIGIRLVRSIAREEFEKKKEQK